MESARRFGEYAVAFEEAYKDDEWTRLEPFFTEDASYEATGEPPLGGRWSGRAALIQQLQNSVNDLDRRFDSRRTELLGQPEISESSFRISWRATYEKEGCPDLVFGGDETAEFEGDCIKTLTDKMEEGSDRRIQEYLKRYFD